MNNDQKLNKYHFVISYSRNIYADAVQPLLYRLDDIGFNTWIDLTEVDLGIDIYKNIFSILGTQNAWISTIVIIDKTYFNKTWCTLELDFLIKNNIPFLPILYKIKKEEFPNKYKDLRRLSYSRIETDESIETTINKIVSVFIKGLDVNKKVFPIKNKILCILLNDYKKTSFNDLAKILKAYNVVTYLKTLQYSTNQIFEYDIIVLMNVIDDKLKQQLINNQYSREDILISDQIITILDSIFNSNFEYD